MRQIKRPLEFRNHLVEFLSTLCHAMRRSRERNLAWQREGRNWSQPVLSCLAGLASRCWSWRISKYPASSACIPTLILQAWATYGETPKKKTVNTCRDIYGILLMLLCSKGKANYREKTKPQTAMVIWFEVLKFARGSWTSKKIEMSRGWLGKRGMRYLQLWPLSAECGKSSLKGNARYAILLVVVKDYESAFDAV